MYEINGLPTHVLVIHGVVVLVPLSALVLVLCAWWPAARVRLAWAGLALTAVATALVPIATNTGEWLRERTPPTPLVATHADLGETLKYWVVPLLLLSAVVAVLSWKRPRVLTPWWQRPDTEGADPLGTGEKVARYVIPVLALVVAIGATVTVVRVGDSGAQAVWKNNVPADPIN